MRPAPLLALLTAAACFTGTPRPVRPAAEFDVTASPAPALAAVLAAVSDQGLPLRAHDEVRGVVETDYVDLGGYYPAAAVFSRAERLVRFRIVVIPADQGYGSRVAIEARYSPFMTGGEIDRRRERAVPGDHPAMEMVTDLKEAITTRAGS